MKVKIVADSDRYCASDIVPTLIKFFPLILQER